jgi:sulfatase modifying factor 1
MLMTRLFLAPFLVGLVQIGANASELGTEPVAEQAKQVQTLPDGNLLDPVPSEEAMASLIENSKKNMVFLKGAQFEMGDWGPEVDKNGFPFDGSPDSKPLHKVRLDSFSIGKYPVTYAEFDIFTAALQLPRINQESVYKKYRKADNSAGVSWQGAKDYCLWLGQKANLAIDLPTEAQWEFAARSGGQRQLYPTDNGKSEPGRNLPSYDQRQAAGGLVTVGSFPPNPAGIYHMSAGIREWVHDWYDATYYQHSPKANPKGPETGSKHVLRGHFGSDDSAMTLKRWKWISKEKTGSWTLYGENRGDATREIPYTKYSGSASETFRCVLNQEKK